MSGMREIVLDTETTGLDPDSGDRVVEIGCLELVNGVPTDRRFHCYINPERDMPEGAFRVHGLSQAFLADKPIFAAIADQFLDFIADAALVIHNASFDLKFLNAELTRLGRPRLGAGQVIDTLEIARRKFPGALNSLDALCRRFAIDLSARDLHGALVDCRLLAEVYLELTGGRQPGLGLAVPTASGGIAAAPLARPVERQARPHAASPEELALHAAFLDQLKNPIWRQ
jgi:DNA polymerase III subunit epsilon